MATPQKNNYNKSSLELLLDFQTRLQGVGNSLADDLDKLISSTDAALLKTIINNLPSAKDSVKHQMWRLNRLTKEIEKIRAEGFDLAEIKAFGYGSEVAKKAGSTVAKLADNRGKIFKKELSDKQISDVLNYHPIDGKSISQWFNAMKQSDLERITQTVQRATVEGMSVAKVVKAIRGTKENDYKDGVLETTRNAATMTARTVINGVASNAMLETCVKNADVIDGIKFIATLDAKTCPFCGSYDGKIWKPEDAAFVKRPPLHPNCRCTVIPYVDMGENLEGERPAAAADFDKLAQDAYNKQAREKGWKRRFDDLSPSTRLKYYYQAQKDYTKQTGKPAYSQVKGDTTFKDYFENQPDSFKKAWLGPKRYELYKAGQYEPLQLANPDTGYVATLDELKKIVEPEPNAEPKKVKKPSVSWEVIENLYEQTERAFTDMESGKKNLAPGDETKVKKLIGLLPNIEFYVENEPDDYVYSPDEVYGGVENMKAVYEEWKEKFAKSVPEPEPAPKEPSKTQKIQHTFPNSLDDYNFDYLGRGKDAEGNIYIRKVYTDDYSPDTLKISTISEEFYKKLGANFTESRLYLDKDGNTVRVYLDIPEGAKSLGNWMKEATPEQIEKIRPTLEKITAADSILGKDVYQESRIYVDKNGNIWKDRVEDYYLGRGLYQNPEQWGIDSISNNAVYNYKNRADKNIKFSDIAQSLKESDLADLLEKLPEREQTVIRKRLERLQKAGEAVQDYENSTKKPKVKDIMALIQDPLNGTNDSVTATDKVTKSETSKITESKGNTRKGKITHNVTMPLTDKELDNIILETREEEKVIDKEIDSLSDEYEELITKYPEEDRPSKIWQRIDDIITLSDELEEKKKNLVLNKLLGPINKDSENYKGAIKVRIPKDLDKEEVRDGLVTVARICDNLGVEVNWRRLHLKALPPGERAFCRKTTAHVGPGDSAGDAVHEFGHAIEYLVPGLGKKIRAVRDSYGKKDSDGSLKIRPLKETGGNFSDDERYIVPRERKIVPSLYTMKDYGSTADEMMSTFFEALYNDPGIIIKEYRQWYKDMVKCFQ